MTARAAHISLLAACVICVLCQGASAGQLTVSADVQGSVCELAAPESGVFEVHVLHDYPGPDVIASLYFSAPPPPCMNAVVVDFVSPHTVFGTIAVGIEVLYSACEPVSEFVGTIRLVATGPSTTCCEYTLSAHSGLGMIGTLPCFPPRIGCGARRQ